MEVFWCWHCGGTVFGIFVAIPAVWLFNALTQQIGALTARLAAISATRSDKTIFLEADRSLLYDRVVQVMDECRAAGMTTIGVITQKPAAAQ